MTPAPPPAPPPCLNRADWRTLYRTAILENNKNILPQRVSEPEEAVILGRKEIFYARTAWEQSDAA
jgi:hypothetical protein